MGLGFTQDDNDAPLNDFLSWEIIQYVCKQMFVRSAICSMA